VQGSSQQEGVHNLLALRLPAKHISPELFDKLLRQVVYEHNVSQSMEPKSRYCDVFFGDIDCVIRLRCCCVFFIAGVKAGQLPGFGTPDMWPIDAICAMYKRNPRLFEENPVPGYEPLTWDSTVPRERFGCERVLSDYQSATAFVEAWTERNGMHCIS
jgi:hypothetical protein